MTARWLPDTPAQYHARRDDHLTQSLAVELLQRSPRHARRKQTARAEPAQPRSEEQAEKRRAMDFGTVAHAQVLGGQDDRIELACSDTGLTREPFPDWRTKAAKEAKARIRAAGRIPVLQKDLDRARQLADAIHEALGEYGIDLAEQDGSQWNERSIEWSEDGTKARGMFDAVHVRLDGAVIYDLKTTGDAHPQTFRRNVDRMGYDVQAAAYVRALEQVYPRLAGRVRFRWILAEVSTAEVVVLEATPGMLHLGGLKWARACRAWARCLAAQHWPGYGRGEIIPVEPPEWAFARELEAAHDDHEQTFAAGALPRAEDDGAEEPEEDEHGENRDSAF